MEKRKKPLPDLEMISIGFFAKNSFKTLTFLHGVSKLKKVYIGYFLLFILYSFVFIFIQRGGNGIEKKLERMLRRLAGAVHGTLRPRRDFGFCGRSFAAGNC